MVVSYKTIHPTGNQKIQAKLKTEIELSAGLSMNTLCSR